MISLNGEEVAQFIHTELNLAGPHYAALLLPLGATLTEKLWPAGLDLPSVLAASATD